MCKESYEKWGDGTPIIKARHILNIRNEEYGDGENEAYRVYDRLTHNETTPKEVIDDYIREYGAEGGGIEDEAISRHTRYWGVSGNYFLTQDIYTGDFDLWEGSPEPLIASISNP